VNTLGRSAGQSWPKIERDIFDDALAEGDSVEAAARRAGRTAAEGRRYFEALCEKLGPQAA